MSWDYFLTGRKSEAQEKNSFLVVMFTSVQQKNNWSMIVILRKNPKYWLKILKI